MTPLQFVYVMSLAAVVFLRPATRSWRGLTLVVAATSLIVAVGLSGWPQRAWAQAAVFAAASVIALFYPGVLRTDRPFADEYAKVDREVWQQLMEAERRWHAGRLSNSEYSQEFDRANVRYRSLRPPNAEWRGIVADRIRIREEWSRTFANAEELMDSERDRLVAAEKRLRRRIAKASG